MGEVQLLFPLHRALEDMLMVFEEAENAPGFLIPPAPVPLDDVLAPLEETCPEAWDWSWELPWDLPGRKLLSLVWEGGCPGGGSAQAYTACQLPGGQRLYALSSDVYPSGFVAMTWEPDADTADSQFLLALLGSNGRDFGLEVLEGAPTEAHTCDVLHWTSWWCSFKLLFQVSCEEFGLDLESFYGLFRYEEYEEGATAPIPGRCAADLELGCDVEPNVEPNWDAVFEWWFAYALPDLAKIRARECAR